jgi:hypothetical protein
VKRRSNASHPHNAIKLPLFNPIVWPNLWIFETSKQNLDIEK